MSFGILQRTPSFGTPAVWSSRHSPPKPIRTRLARLEQLHSSPNRSIRTTCPRPWRRSLSATAETPAVERHPSGIRRGYERLVATIDAAPIAVRVLAAIGVLA